VSRCPEALYGHHGVPNTQGRCPYCSEKLTTRNWHVPSTERRGRGTRSIDRKTEDWLDSRERERDSLTGTLRIPAELDPEVDPDPDDSIYD
jgi:hypothetical protein